MDFDSYNDFVSDNIIASSDGDKSQKIQPSETEKTNNTEKTEPYVVTEIPDTEIQLSLKKALVLSNKNSGQAIFPFILFNTLKRDTNHINN